MRLIIAGLAAGLLVAAGALGPDPATRAAAQDEDDWAAWVDRMPPGPPALHVTGKVALPHRGFQITLTPSEPQGINPAILMLDLEVAERPGIHAQAVATREVRYDIPDYDGRYEQVSILRNGEIIAHIDAIAVTY